MKEHPIIFSTEMVKAILDGRKTQTRRVIKPQPESVYYSLSEPSVQRMKWRGCTYRPATCAESPYGQIGDRLWVREAYLVLSKFLDYEGKPILEDKKPIYYKTQWQNDLDYGRVGEWAKGEIRWQSPIFMPRWASRILLEITGIRVERLQEITEEDAKAEGSYLAYDTDDNEQDFIYLWNSINAKRGYSWESNPWVWVIEFKKIMP